MNIAIDLAFLATGAIISILLLFTVPRHVLFVACLLLNVFATVGSGTSSGSLLPSSKMLAVTAIAFILMALIPDSANLSNRMRFTVVLALAGIVFWTCISLHNFGLRADFVGNSIRILSYVGALVVAYRMASDSSNPPLRNVRSTNLIVGLPALFLIGGYLARWAPTIYTNGRAYGSFTHANAAAAFFAVGTIACIAGYRKTRSPTSLAVACTGLIALVLTQSLGGLAAFGIGAVLLIGLDPRASRLRRISTIVVGISVVLLISHWLNVAGGRLEDFEGLDPIGAIVTGTDNNSLEWRLVYWSILLTMWWQQARILGFGLGATDFEIQPYGYAPHSVPVQIIVEMGLVGVIFTAALVTLTLVSIRSRYRSDPEAAATLLSVTAVIFVHSTESNWLGYSPAMYLVMYIFGSLLGRSGEAKPTPEVNSDQRISGRITIA